MDAKSLKNRYFCSSSDQVSNILNPSRGVRDDMKRRGIKPKDHSQENYRKIKQLQQQVKNKNEESSKVTEKFVLSQFKDVPSKFTHKIEEIQNNVTEKKEYLKSHLLEERLEQKSEDMRSKIVSIDTPEPETFPKPPVPKKTDIAPLQPRTDKNFISQNARSVKAAPDTPKSTNSSTSSLPPPTTKDFGKVPDYILERKRELAEEKEKQRIAELKKNECPPGMRVMPEEERLQTVQVLTENREQLMQELMKMPIACDTSSLRRKKSNIEAKLSEIESALTLFSRKRVFLALE